MLGLFLCLFLSLSLSLRRCVVSRHGSGLVNNDSPSSDYELTLNGKLFPKRTNMQSRAGPTEGLWPNVVPLSVAASVKECTVCDMENV